MRRALFAFVTTILVASLLLALIPPTGVPSPRRFDADRLAGLEVQMWQAYYAKQRVRLGRLLLVMLHEQFHLSWATAATTGFHLARAAAAFGDATGDYEVVLPDLTRAFESIRAHTDGSFDPSVVARAELAWWVARRIPAERAPDHVGDLIAHAYSQLYDARCADMQTPGRLRARAAALRDAEAGQPDWVTITQLLEESYRTLHARLQ